MRGRLAAGVAATLVASLAAPAPAQIALGPGAIVARVRDASGQPLVGALVSADGPTSRDATTNAAGLVSLVALPAGRYVVAISAAGYAPWQTAVVVGSIANAPALVTPFLQPASLANLGAPALTTLALPGLGDDLDPYVAHALIANPSLEVVPSAGGASVSLDGTLPYESRVELDGIPLAGGFTSPAAVRFRDLLGLSGIDVVAGPSLGNAPVRDAIGGIVNYRTPATDSTPVAGVDAGYDSAFGSFQHARVVRDVGRFGVAFDAVTGGGSDRSQSLKASYAFAPGTSADFAIYALQSAGDIGTTSGVETSAPAYSAGVRARLGGGSFEARAHGSSLAVTSPSSTALVGDENARVRGLALAYDLPLGQDRIGVAFDRRTEIAALGDTAPVSQTFTSFGARGTIALAPIARLELGETYSGGTLVRARNDPDASFALRPSRALELRLSAGSSFATAPDDVLAGRTAASGALPPETAFGFRITADARLDASDRAWLAAYSERRFATFATLADAANRGVGIGFERAPAHGFGASAYVALERSDLIGSLTPEARRSIAFVDGTGAELPADPGAKERVALTYRFTAACEERVGATFVGTNNGLSPAAVTLAEVSLCVPLFAFGDVRVGESNAFGASVLDPSLAPLYRPHEYTFSFGLR